MSNGHEAQTCFLSLRLLVLSKPEGVVFNTGAEDPQSGAALPGSTSKITKEETRHEK